MGCPLDTHLCRAGQRRVIQAFPAACKSRQQGPGWAGRGRARVWGSLPGKGPLSPTWKPGRQMLDSVSFKRPRASSDLCFKLLTCDGGTKVPGVAGITRPGFSQNPSGKSAPKENESTCSHFLSTYNRHQWQHFHPSLGILHLSLSVS